MAVKFHESVFFAVKYENGNEFGEILISVIIPAYNCTGYIRHALNSALAQDVPLEIIVIDDNSTDDLDQVMEEYRDCLQVRYIKNGKNYGVAKTRSRGVAAARGQYVAFLDADDIWAEGKLKKQLELLLEKNAVLCSTARELITPDGKSTGYIIPVKTEFTYRQLLISNQINCSSVLVKTEVAREFPMHNDDGHEDYLTWLEILKKYGKAYAINEPLIKYRVSDTGKSGNKLKSARMTFITYRHMGFSFPLSCILFVGYAFCGIRKYFMWYLRSIL